MLIEFTLLQLEVTHSILHSSPISMKPHASATSNHLASSNNICTQHSEHLLTQSHSEEKSAGDAPFSSTKLEAVFQGCAGLVYPAGESRAHYLSYRTGIFGAAPAESQLSLHCAWWASRNPSEALNKTCFHQQQQYQSLAGSTKLI